MLKELTSRKKPEVVKAADTGSQGSAQAQHLPAKSVETRKVQGTEKPEDRSLLSIKPSEAKATVKVNGATYKVTYHTHDGLPMIGIAGQPSVPVDLWLAGQAHLKGLR